MLSASVYRLLFCPDLSSSLDSPLRLTNNSTEKPEKMTSPIDAQGEVKFGSKAKASNEPGGDSLIIHIYESKTNSERGLRLSV